MACKEEVIKSGLEVEGEGDYFSILSCWTFGPQTWPGESIIKSVTV